MRNRRVNLAWFVLALVVALVPTTANAVEANWKRLGGQTDQDTMEIINQKYLKLRAEADMSAPDTVIVATRDDYWDALAANGVAGLYDAPIVTTGKASLGEQAQRVLAEIKPTHVIIMGGPNAIKQPVEKKINEILKEFYPDSKVEVERYQGQTQQDTAEVAYQKSKAAGMAWGDTCVIATDNGYWDSLSIASFAYSHKAPIFLTNSGTNKLSDERADLIASNFNKVVIVGGRNAVSMEVEGQLTSRNASIKIQRLWGEREIDTSATIVRWEVSPTWTDANGKVYDWTVPSPLMGCKHMVVATTNGYWDGLAGGPLAGLGDSVIALVYRDSADYDEFQAVKEGWSLKGDFKEGYILGLTDAISKKTGDWLIYEYQRER